MKINNMQCCVVLVNWNSARDTVNCIVSLNSSGINMKDIIVVDNASKDDSVDYIIEHFQNIRILRSDVNGGFGYACNLGIKYAIEKGYEYVWLLNNDTIINEKTLEEMYNYSKIRNKEIVGSVLRDMDFPWGIQAIGGGKVNFFTGRTEHIYEIEKLSSLRYITGASMLIKASVFEKIGLFDEDFFMYWEDVEFCIRAVKRGCRLGVSMESNVYHKEGGSALKQSYNQTRMIFVSMRKFFYKTSKIYFIPIFVRQCGKSIKSIADRDLGRLFYIWK